MQAFLSTTILALTANQDISIPNSNQLLINSTVSRNAENWETISFEFTTTTGGEKYLYLGLLNNSVIVNNVAIENTTNCEYSNQNLASSFYNITGYYIDNVSLIPIPSTGSFNLPTVINCNDNPIANLLNLVSGYPINGTFSGAGVVLNSGIYSFDPIMVGVDVASISYTYIDNNCSKTIIKNINVNATIVPTFNQIPAICYGALLSLPTTSNNGFAGT